MSMRFASNLVLAVLGGLLVILSLKFGLATTRWLALGGGSAAVLVTLVAFATRGRGATQRSIDVTVALLGGWTIVASGAFAGATLRWLTFSEAAALGALAAAGLIAHELGMQQELRDAAEAAEPAAARRATVPPGIPHPVPARADVAA
jgi:hypothetical protein